MYCKYCGKQIQEDSVFCPYCGKSLEKGVPCPSSPKPNQLKKSHWNPDISVVSSISTFTFYVGIITFVILYGKMAPGISTMQFIAYVAGVAAVILLAVLINKIRSKKYTVGRQMIALLFGLFLLIPSITLRIIYEIKIDDATANIPKSGVVCVAFSKSEEFYSYYNEAQIREPYSYVIIDDERYDSNTRMYITLNHQYPITIGAGYEGEVGVADSENLGKKSKTVSFTDQKLRGGYSFTESVPLRDNDEFAKVTLRFERVCTFWEAILD